PPEVLLPLAYSLAEEVYPDLVQNDVNQVPAWLPWLVPTPAWSRRPPTPAGKVYFWIYLILASVLTSVLIVLVAQTPLVDFAVTAFQYVGRLLPVMLPPQPGDVFSQWLPRGLTVLGAASFALAAGTMLFRRFEFVFRALPLIFSPAA